MMKIKIKSKIFTRVVVFNAVNIVLLLLTFLILQKLSSRALGLRDARNMQISKQENTDLAVLEADLSGRKTDIDKLQSVFVNESSFLDFLQEKDQLQASGLITNFSVSDKPVKDTDGNKGYALLIEFSGQRDSIVSALADFEKLPFFKKMVSLDIDVPSDSDQLHIKYLGFLYTNE